MDKQEFLNAISGSDIDKRFAAWRSAGEQNADVVERLVELSEGADPGVAKAASEALTTMTHAVGKDLNDPKRAPLVEALAKKHSMLTLRLLSNIAGDSVVDNIAKSLLNADLREEAIYALERIPGPVASKAILAAYPKVEESFKPRILYALGHRRVAEARLVCQRASTSTNPELRSAGGHALGRLEPGTGKIVFTGPNPDSKVRIAEKASPGLAIALYKELLAQPQEHLQCAALVGLGKIGTAQAAQLVFPFLKSPDRKVRLTAAQVWNRFVRGENP